MPSYISLLFTHTPHKKPYAMPSDSLLPTPFHKQTDCASLDNLSEVNRRRNFKFVKGNICSSDLVNFVLEEEEIDTVLHLAAQTHVDNSFGNSFSFTQNNILGTHVLLESAKVHGIKRFVHCSTDEVYGEGTADQEPMFEDNVLEVRKEFWPKRGGKRRRWKPGIGCL
jgi:UDP-glucose 4,6-dehydratase